MIKFDNQGVRVKNELEKFTDNKLELNNFQTTQSILRESH